MVFHGTALQGFWRADDGAHLKFAVDYSPWAYFFDPAVTRGQSGANVTPWNVFFYDVNLTLFGFLPRWHYAHLLLVLTACAITLHLVLRIWLPMAQSLVGATAFLLGKPTAYVAQYLMTGHYATGLLFSLLAILAWNHAVHTERRWSLAAAAFLYLLATTCKEVYVPLVLVLIALPIGSVRQRLRLIWPFALVAFFYAGWRYLVLGHLVGGYTPSGDGLNLASVLDQFAAIPRLLTGNRLLGSYELLVFLSLWSFAAFKKRLNFKLMALSVVVLLVPLVPLTTYPGIHAPDRYLFVIWAAIAALIAAILPRQRGSYAAIIIGVSLLAAFGIESRREQTALAPELARNDALYHFALEADPVHQGLFVKGDDGYWSLILTTIRHARNKFDGLDDAAPSLLTVSDSPIVLGALASSDLVERQFYRYAEGSMMAFDLGEMHRQAVQQVEKGVGKPMTVAIRYEHGAVHWSFGPYPGRYLISVDGIGTVRVSASGSYPWKQDRLLRIRSCYESAEGWAGCSPSLTMSPGENPSLAWSGMAALPR